MSTHLTFNDRDLYEVDLILKEWTGKGFVGDIDEATANQGVVRITTSNWKRKDGSYVTMELHKLRGGRGLFGDKAVWIVRLFSHASQEFSSVTMHGCIEGRKQLSALNKALLDVGYDFMSQTRLENYFTR